MSLKSFKKSKNDKKLVPKLFILSYAVIGVGLIIYLYILFCEKVPSGKILFYPEWEILKGGSCSCDLDHFTLSDKELSQLYIIGPFFVAMGSLLKLLGLKRQ
jgi:hypothetical protein